MTEWVVAFALVMYQGVGDGRREVTTNLTFYSVDRCLYFADRLAKRHGNYEYVDLMDPRDRVTTYCVPRAVDPTKMRVY